MGALRLLYLIAGVTGLSAALTDPVHGQEEAAALGAAVEVTSSILDEGALPDFPDVAEEALEEVAPLLGEALPDGGALADLPEEISPLAPAVSLRPEPRDTWAVPAAAWDDHPRGPAWTAAVLSALRGPGAALLEVEPRDIRAWCPGYLEATPSQRAAFWTGLVSTLAWHESTHRPRAVGGGGRWFGLVQIAPGTARWRNCDVGSGEALLHGPSNLRCGIRIMAITVPRDGVVADGMRGVAADWGPFHSSRKREEMRSWVREQSYCQLPPPPMRPVMRPVDLGVTADLTASADDGRLRPMPRPAVN
ncbi:transglycosylase SLT domain-containing protein [Hasllibacter sp. MH4015]|uniref:transglycosylase SLT domain-containing protein n=1 Tax=Hasllibacter sp. MH4015 TaxID=2854029 RepID=UPI001CD5FE37|nr:transglycosylase SLT domain-containing protein [Hasllibacter sp. MH4015]